jgi:hypothetical protein
MVGPGGKLLNSNGCTTHSRPSNGLRQHTLIIDHNRVSLAMIHESRPSDALRQ